MATKEHKERKKALLGTGCKAESGELLQSMTLSVARQIMRLVATFSIMGPLVVGYALGMRVIAFDGQTQNWVRYMTYSGLVLVFGVAVYSWGKFGQYLNRYERSDLMRRALWPAGSLLFFLPLLISTSGYWIGFVWPPFWGALMNLVSLLLTGVEAQVREALERDAH